MSSAWFATPSPNTWWPWRSPSFPTPSASPWRARASGRDGWCRSWAWGPARRSSWWWRGGPSIGTPPSGPIPVENPMTTFGPIDPGTTIGHVHLKVADLERALGFYVGVLGFTLTQRYGAQAAFVAAGGYHHHIGLNTWESRGGGPPAPGTTGLYHVAIRYPTRAALADALRRLVAARVPLDGASDHGVSEALYLRDPDDNGVEL
ncbi:MAG: VOC family protein, partial [Gemmatimonadales bacterium]|nr:VOC family protein [Gemmatimonadales bacterium]